MESAEEYLEELIAITCRLNSSWEITTKNVFDERYDKEQFLSTLKSLNHPSVYEEYLNGSYDSFIEENKNQRFDQLIAKLAKPLREDINDCTKGKFKSLLDKTYLSFLPLTKLAAFTTNRKHTNEKLDGFIICINNGLYFCANILTKAFLFENLTGDLQSYRKDGAPNYARAMRMYLRPNKEDLNSIFLDNSHIPPSIFGQISAYHSSMSSMILQFVALHEFGHIVNDDVSNDKFLSLHFAKVLEDKIDTNDLEVKELWNAEYAADFFAMKSLSDRSNNIQAVWANFLTIYLFFKWLDGIEKLTKKVICPNHPPPTKRAKYLMIKMHRIYGINQEAQEMMNTIDRWTHNWLSEINEAGSIYNYGN